ncbi:hypothetical protein FA95DRAFT_1577324 [Auriscalpium vulgare]|uniref:Uncharacterized protein n=1 Tax=Auriscalpium vulgare TaxID=40419 RepID=A0ACB8R7V4_9AGAM|nr:hypothetical protein FA95DRAFT_1577324 [Auriscalpium vulgare]
MDAVAPIWSWNAVVPGLVRRCSFLLRERKPKSYCHQKIAEAIEPEWLLKCPVPEGDSVNVTFAAGIVASTPGQNTNFLWDGATVLLVDWQHANLLPHSFASSRFHSNTDDLVKAIAGRISSTKLQLMTGIVVQSGILDYNVDEYGRSHRSA